MRASVLLYLGFFFLVTRVQAEPCDANTAAIVTSKPGLWTILKPSELGRPYVVRPFHGEVVDTSRCEAFVFSGRMTKRLQGKEGALTVRIARMAFSAEAPAAEVTLRRQSYSSSCRPWTSVDWGLDFGGGEKETVQKYVTYHVSNLNVSSVINRFHMYYDSENDGCVRTDSASGQRRSGFVSTYDGPPLSIGQENVARLYGTVAPSTLAAPNHSPPRRSFSKA